jgi:ABC-type sugar transport system substrate-binding protein
MLKKSLALTIALGTAPVVLAACGGSSGPTASSSSSASSGTTGGTKSLQFVNPLPKNPQWQAAGQCIGKEAKARGLDYTESGPTGSGIDPTTMITQVQQAIANKKSAITTFPVSAGFAPVLQQAQKAGIVTLTILGSGKADSGADLNIGLNWTKIGELFVTAVAARPGQQNVGLIEDSPQGAGKDFTNGVKAAAAATSNVKIVGTVYTGDDTAKALNQTTALLTAHPEINVIMTHQGTATPGAIAAIKAKGKTGKVAFIGNGPGNGGKEALANGTAFAMLFQDLCGAGTIIADSVADRLEGKTSASGSGPTNLAGLPAAIGTKADYQSYIDKGWA